MLCSSLATKALDSVPDRLWRICPKQNFKMNKNWNIKICFKNCFLMIQSAFCAENIVPRPGCDFQKYLPLAPFRFTPAPKSQNASQWDTSPKHGVTQCDCVMLCHRLRSYHSCTFKSYSYLSASGTSVRLRPCPLPEGKRHATHLAYTGLAKQFEASIDSLCEVWPAWLHESREVPTDWQSRSGDQKAKWKGCMASTLSKRTFQR